jgi:excisionase family DNA binding protein
MLPLGEVAIMLGKSPRTLKRLYLAGEMPAKRLGRSLLIPSAWVDEFTAWPAARQS